MVGQEGIKPGIQRWNPVFVELDGLEKLEPVNMLDRPAALAEWVELNSKMVIFNAKAAARTKTYLGALYQRLAARRGAKRAAVAVAHAILVIAYHLLSRNQIFRELGSNYFDKRQRLAVQRRLVRRLEALGLEVSIQPIAGPA